MGPDYAWFALARPGLSAAQARLMLLKAVSVSGETFVISGTEYAAQAAAGRLGRLGGGSIKALLGRVAGGKYGVKLVGQKKPRPLAGWLRQQARVLGL